MFEETVSVVSIWASVGSWLTPAVLFVLLNVMIGTIAVTSGFSSANHHQNKTQNNKAGHHPNGSNQSNHNNHESHEPTHQYFFQQQQQSPIQTHLSRSPSVIERLKSMNFTCFRFQHYQYHPSLATNTATTVTTDPEQYTAPVEKISADLDAHFGEFHAHHEVETRERNRNGPVRKEARNNINREFFQAYTIPKPEPEPKGESREEEEEVLVDGDEPTMDQVYSRIQMMSRSKSETKPSSGLMVEKLPKKMMKAASDVSAFDHFPPDHQEEEDDEILLRVDRRRLPPVPARRKKLEERAAAHLDEEVDTKADDFINKFRQQLKLQRIESILQKK